MKTGENYVRMGQHVCFVCGKKFPSGEILLHKNLRDIPADKTVTGVGICREDQQRIDDGFVIMIGADPARSEIIEDEGKSTVKGKDAHRTGSVVYLQREVFAKMFSKCEIPDPPVVFCEQKVIDMLARWEAQAQAEETDDG